jgi:hypothetical protein
VKLDELREENVRFDVTLDRADEALADQLAGDVDGRLGARGGTPTTAQVPRIASASIALRTTWGFAVVSTT